ncbi:MAG: hypothetical protein LUQ36_02210, partial [Methanoregula sp.]|nr:hypothetical protein [Methanoregula sp.]
AVSMPAPHEDPASILSTWKKFGIRRYMLLYPPIIPFVVFYRLIRDKKQQPTKNADGLLILA